MDPPFALLPHPRLFTGYEHLPWRWLRVSAPHGPKEPAWAPTRALWGSLHLDRADSAPTVCAPGRARLASRKLSCALAAASAAYPGGLGWQESAADGTRVAVGAWVAVAAL